MADRAIPILPSADLERTASFLDRIGFTVANRYDGYLLVERGPVELHFYERAGHDPATTAEMAYVRVDDVEAWYAAAVAAGLEVWSEEAKAELASRWRDGRSIARISPLEAKPWGVREFALLDEDNNLIRVGQPLPTAG